MVETRDKLSLVAVWGLLALALTVTDAPGRALVVVGFLLLGPGLTMVAFAGIQEQLFRLALAVAVSLAVDILAALAMIYAGVWEPVWCLAALTALTFLGAAAAHLSRRTPETPPAEGAPRIPGI
jgi:uncharacterized membrane protein